MVFVLTALLAVPAFAAPSGTLHLQATTTLFSGDVIHWEFEFSDSFFDQKPSEYNHFLARASLGLAVSAYRNNVYPEQPKDIWVNEYLTQAGFTDLRSEGYDQEPGEHTISTMIGKKKIGQSTVIVVVPCGGGYQNEWLSNFTVGTGERHEGFNEAALQVEDRLFQYIEDYAIEGNVKLWTAGYSRAAAVSNIVAADMTDTGMFKAVYSYNFATPRTTKNKGNYNNIFNILGKYDPVTMIPFADWGYERYGVELYTPAQEMDSYYYEKTVVADEVSKKMMGKKFTNNPEINGQLHMLMEYLLQILPTDTDYDVNLEESLKGAWVSDSVNKLLEIIAEAVRNMKFLNGEQQTEAKAMLNFLDNVVMAYMKGTDKREKDGYWDGSVDTGTNIIREHNPSTYIEWMFSSDNPKEIFTGSNVSKQVIITGAASVEIYGEDGFIETIDRDGDISYKVPKGESLADKSRKIYAVRKGSQTIITLPGDMLYRLKIHSPKDESMDYMVATYSTEKLTPDTTKLISFSAKKDKVYWLEIYPMIDYPILSDEQGGPIKGWASSFEYTPAMMFQLENLNVFHVSIGATAGILAGSFVFLLLTILVVILVCIIHFITCRRRGKPYSKYYVIVPHLMLILLFFLMSEISGYLLSAVSIVGAIYITIGNLIMTLLAVRGSIRHRCKRNTIIWISLLILTVAGFFLFRYTGVGAITTAQFIAMGCYFLLGSFAAVYTFPHEGKHFNKKAFRKKNKPE